MQCMTPRMNGFQMFFCVLQFQFPKMDKKTENGVQVTPGMVNMCIKQCFSPNIFATELLFFLLSFINF